MKTQTTKIFIAGMLMIGMVGLLRSQPMLSQSVSPTQPNAAKDFLPPSYRGSWTGTLQYVGSPGQMLLFIDPSGNLYGSLKSNDGSNFAQISGDHHENVFHLIFTPPTSSI